LTTYRNISLFFYSQNRPRLTFIYRSTVIWLSYAVFHARCSALSSASARTSGTTQRGSHLQGAWTDYTDSSYVINFERDIKIFKILSINFLSSVNWLKTATNPIAVTQLAKFKCSTIS